ncbi:MAG TPA: DNA polymerase domain-containing protein [Bacteroidota bacterium]|nr:DNA polymerase domain-containing protein [Bacteroidota bacterium]
MPTARTSEGENTQLEGSDPVLYGQNPLEHVVAVQQLNETSVRMYRRAPRGQGQKSSPGNVTYTDAEFFPFFFLSNQSLLENFQKRFWSKELAGSRFYRHLVAFPRWNDMWEAIRSVLVNYNKSALRKAGHFTELESVLLKADPSTQFLLQSGITLFKGLTYADLNRMQISIQTFSRNGRKSDARKTEDRILVIALSDNFGWEEVLDGRKLSESAMLGRLAEHVCAKDPDVLEGHDLLDHILPYLLRRSEINSVTLSIGRDGSDLRSYSPRGNPLETGIENAIYEAAGRHLVDTKVLAHAYSSSRRGPEHFGLRYLSQHFGLATTPAVVIGPDRMAAVWNEQPAQVIAQAQTDCSDIRGLSELLSPSYFFQARMVPMTYETLMRAGSAAKIEAMMLREYIRQKHSVPRPESGGQQTGGYTDIFVTGVINGILHADIESLYPSIMLTQKIQPSTDDLGVFQQLLRTLTAARLEAKRSMGSASNENQRSTIDAFQSSLKILINSFYGYLGYPRGVFNDFAQADRVTSGGQELLKIIIREVELHNGTVIEADTDGLYFIPPDNVRGEERELVFVEKLSQSLPSGIHLVLAGRYSKMLSYRKKNYALLDYSNRPTIRGSSLISRTLERFAKNYIQFCISHLLQHDIQGLHKLYISLLHDIAQHRWEALDFCRTETIRDTMEEYDRGIKEGTRKPTAVYEVARRSGLPVRPGDRVSYYVTGSHAGVKIVDNSKLAEEWDPNFPDENSAYYVDRLNECSRKFEVFFEPDDFKRIFSADDLFGFSPDNIRLRDPQAVPRSEGTSSEDEPGDFGIWLDDAATDH